MDGNDSEFCPVAGFGTVCVETSESANVGFQKVQKLFSDKLY
jgi:hypothetical protein